MTYRLGSSSFVWAPGLIKWAQNGFHFEDDRPMITKVIAETWRIPKEVAEALCSGAPFEVEDSAVVFSM